MVNKSIKEVGDTALQKVITGIVTSISIEVIMQSAKFIFSLGTAKIEISEWDSAYENINKALYQIGKKQYDQYRMPTTNKESFILTDNISYIVRLDKFNFLRVNTSLAESNKMMSERTLSLVFTGKQKHVWRAKFLMEALNLTDKNHILVQHLSSLKCNIIPHSFDNIILSPTIKNDIIDGLTNWANSKEWYERHQLVHKIGVFLYGKPGTGKSTIAKAISTMFDNAPILTIDPDNVMDSIKDILKMRKRYNKTICVLIEDFDMFFRKRDENGEETEEDKNVDTSQGKNTAVQVTGSNEKKSKDFNQNAIFQLLDGVYSTDDTIYIATTNYKEHIDSALIRYGRFDIQEELDYFDRDQALDCVKLLDYDEKCLDSLDLIYPVQPSYLQSKIMEYRAKELKKRKEL